MQTNYSMATKIQRAPCVAYNTWLPKYFVIVSKTETANLKVKMYIDIQYPEAHTLLSKADNYFGRVSTLF